MGERGHPGPPGPPGEQGLPGPAGKEGAKVRTNSGHTHFNIYTQQMHIYTRPQLVNIISGLYREIQVLQDPQVKTDLQDSEGSRAREAYQDLWWVSRTKSLTIIIKICVPHPNSAQASISHFMFGASSLLLSINSTSLCHLYPSNMLWMCSCMFSSFICVCLQGSAGLKGNEGPPGPPGPAVSRHALSFLSTSSPAALFFACLPCFLFLLYLFAPHTGFSVSTVIQFVWYWFTVKRVKHWDFVDWIYVAF